MGFQGDEAGHGQMRPDRQRKGKRPAYTAGGQGRQTGHGAAPTAAPSRPTRATFR